MNTQTPNISIRLSKIIGGACFEYAEFDNITGIEFGIDTEFSVYYDCQRIVTDISIYTDLKVIIGNEQTEYNLNSKSWQQDLAFYLYNKK